MTRLSLTIHSCSRSKKEHRLTQIHTLDETRQENPTNRMQSWRKSELFQSLDPKLTVGERSNRRFHAPDSCTSDLLHISQCAHVLQVQHFTGIAPSGRGAWYAPHGGLSGSFILAAPRACNRPSGQYGNCSTERIRSARAGFHRSCQRQIPWHGRLVRSATSSSPG